MMMNTENQHPRYMNLTEDYFNHLIYQKGDQDKFTAVRQNVINFVEEQPLQSCDAGWTYDHSLVFNTITSEVSLNIIIGIIHLLHIPQNDWVCEEDYKPTLIHTVFWIGNTVGCFLWGFTNDL